MSTQLTILNRFYSRERSGILISNIPSKIRHEHAKIAREWIFEVCQEIRLNLMTYDLTIELFNMIIRIKYLHIEKIQGYIIACNYIAHKMLTVGRPQNYIRWRRRSNNTYTLNQLKEYEADILS